MFDGWEASAVGGKAWEPCMRNWCAIGHMSCSLVSSRAGGVFQLGASQMRGAGGVILAPETPITCSYPGDGGTANAQMCCGGCDPGRSYPPSNLVGMLQMYEQSRRNSNNPYNLYNEVVVSSRVWMDHLPGIIQGFIPGHGRNDMATAARAAFIAAYQLDPNRVPMVALG